MCDTLKYRYYLSSRRLCGVLLSAVILGTPVIGFAASAPDAVTHYATDVAYSSVVLHGAVGPGGLQTDAWFEYGTTESLGNTTAAQPVGGGAAYVGYSLRVNNLQPRTTYYYRAVAHNSQDTASGAVFTFVTGAAPGVPPTVSTESASTVEATRAVLVGSANPQGVRSSGWFEFGTSRAVGQSTLASFQDLGSGINNVNFFFSMNGLAPGTVYYYRAVAENQNGVVRGSMTSFTTRHDDTFSGGGVVPTGTPGATTPPSYTPPASSFPAGPFVVTFPAAYTFQNSALLNGSANPNNLFTRAWFEWGKTTALGTATAPQPMGGGAGYLNYSFVLSGLEPGVAYYYQAVAQNNLGIARGSLMSFTTTPRGAVVAPVPPRLLRPSSPILPRAVSAPHIEAEAAVVLLPSAEPINPQAGEEMQFTTTYKNEGRGLIKDAALNIFLPKEVEYVRADLAPSSQNAEKISFALGDLGAEARGAVTIRVRVKPTTEDGSVIVFHSTMDYVNAEGRAQSVNVFFALTVRGAGRTVAALFASFPGWWLIVLLFIFILLLFFFLYRSFAKRKQGEEERNGGGTIGGIKRI